MIRIYFNQHTVGPKYVLLSTVYHNYYVEIHNVFMIINIMTNMAYSNYTIQLGIVSHYFKYGMEL